MLFFFFAQENITLSGLDIAIRDLTFFTDELFTAILIQFASIFSFSHSSCFVFRFYVVRFRFSSSVYVLSHPLKVQSRGIMSERLLSNTGHAIQAIPPTR